MPPTLLITRPLAQSRAFLASCEAAAGRSLPAVISPLIEVRPTGAPLPAGTLVLTSGRAAEMAGDLTGRRAYCVGDRTAELARRAGAETVSAKGNQADLVTLLAHDRPGHLVHLHGTHRRGGLAAALGARGLTLEEVAVYATQDLLLTSEARALLAAEGNVLAPVFSPRTAALLASYEATAVLTVIAISQAAADPFRGRAEIAVAARPDAEAVIAEVLRLLGRLS